MGDAIRKLFFESSVQTKSRLIVVYSVLAVLNIGGWIWALLAFHNKPVLLGVCLVVYIFGLRHAVDADHLAAIDNVIRKLIEMDQKPVSVGFFFALGHSTAVIVAVCVLVLIINDRNFDFAYSYTGAISTMISGFFLFSIGIMNLIIFFSLYKTYTDIRKTGIYYHRNIENMLSGCGLLTRLFRPVFKLITKSWHMYLLGFLFALGFDTATEVAVFGLSETQASHGLLMSSILVFPVLFAAGMSLIDTTDGVLMLGAYEWAFIKPVRKIYYNMTITLMSVIVALFTGSIEILGMLDSIIKGKGMLWSLVRRVNEKLDLLGFLIIGVFLLVGVVSFFLYRWRNIDNIEVEVISQNS